MYKPSNAVCLITTKKINTYIIADSSKGRVSLSWMRGLDEPLLDVVLDMDGGLTSIR